MTGAKDLEKDFWKMEKLLKECNEKFNKVKEKIIMWDSRLISTQNYESEEEFIKELTNFSIWVETLKEEDIYTAAIPTTGPIKVLSSVDKEDYDDFL